MASKNSSLQQAGTFTASHSHTLSCSLSLLSHHKKSTTITTTTKSSALLLEEDEVEVQEVLSDFLENIGSFPADLRAKFELLQQLDLEVQGW